MVIVRCIGPEEFFLERVVFPFELLSFMAPGDAEVQIWTHGLGGPELRESIAARDLCIEPETDASNTLVNLIDPTGAPASGGSGVRQAS